MVVNTAIDASSDRGNDCTSPVIHRHMTLGVLYRSIASRFLSCHPNRQITMLNTLGVILDDIMHEWRR
jgi:hypothetical protein